MVLTLALIIAAVVVGLVIYDALLCKPPCLTGQNEQDQDQDQDQNRDQQQETPYYDHRTKH